MPNEYLLAAVPDPGLILNKTFHCTFKTMGYYGGQCKCSEQVQVFV